VNMSYQRIWIREKTLEFSSVVLPALSPYLPVSPERWLLKQRYWWWWSVRLCAAVRNLSIGAWKWWLRYEGHLACETVLWQFPKVSVQNIMDHWTCWSTWICYCNHNADTFIFISPKRQQLTVKNITN